jgi:phosphoadenosine phosphosulfate reductase
VSRAPLAPDELAARSAELESATPQEILAYALEIWSPRLALSTAFGVEGCALVDMAARIAPGLKVFTVDTGLLFDENEALARTLRERYPIEVITFRPALSVAEQQESHGPRLWERDPDACCAMRKVEPTRRALAELDCWLAALRRDQATSRAGIQILERYDHPDGHTLVKVHPLARWSRTDVWRYVMDHGVPYNPLLDEGYTSVGCRPCTQPVQIGGGERSGRWGGRKEECGIHTFMKPPRE